LATSPISVWSHRPGDHPGLAEAAAAGAAAEDLHRHPLVHGLGQRDQRLLRVRPLVQVHDRVLGHPERHAGLVRRDPADAAVGQVVDVVEARHVDVAGLGQAEQQLLAAAGAALGLPRPDDVGDREHRALAVADHGGVQEVGDRLGVERGVPAGQHDRVLVGPVPGLERDPGQVQRVQHVRVAELGGEGQAEDVEVPHRPVRVHGELRDAALPHRLLHVRPDRVGPLGQHALALVEHFVQDHDALVGQPDLVGVRVHQGPADVAGVPVLDGRVELAADVLDRLLHTRQDRFELREHGLT
jgi:hypothetical protein